MTFQTTYFVPWDEPEFMKMLEHIEGVTCIAEDTQGKTYRTPYYVTNWIPITQGSEDVHNC